LSARSAAGNPRSKEETDTMTDTFSQLPELTRRRFLAGTALAGTAAFLAACSGGNGGATTAPGGSGEPTATGPLQFANWDAYIDLTEVGDGEYDLPSPTLDEFSQEYGVEVEYANAQIEDNESFMATIRPQLQSGVETGWDIIVLTDWMAAKVVAAGWAEEIDPAVTATAAANVRDELKGLPWDPDMTYHYPWQSGATGIGYNSASTGRELTKVADLFDPAFAGKVTLLTESRDTFPLIHLALQGMGQASDTPAEEMTVEDAQAVHDYLAPFVDNGHIRAFTGNEYLQDFGSGDTWAAIVWSGDLASSAGPDDVFVFPEEGSMIWTDNMLIPKGAANKYTAELMIDWVYDVTRAARLANFIYYISPVKGVDEAIKELDPEAGDNPLLFPPAEIVEQQHPQPNWSEEDEAAINELFAALTGV
jgi:spermidine/putrescine transport system substrate-binding protein